MTDADSIAVPSNARPTSDVDRARMARFIMALRARGVRDPRVLNAFERMPRERFLPAAMEGYAYEDWTLPIPWGQTATSPFTLAWLCQAMELTTAMKALEIGTGTGFGAAMLGSLCRRVHTVERVEELHRVAQGRLAGVRLGNVDTVFADGLAERVGAGFDRIVVHGRLEEAPAVLLHQLSHDGRLVFVRGEDWVEVARSPSGSDAERVLGAGAAPEMRSGVIRAG